MPLRGTNAWAALERWDKTRTPPPLRHVGIDEKNLGRRNQLADDFVTIVSNTETGEPLWIGYGRREETVAAWLKTLAAAQKATITPAVMDMHRPFANAIRNDPARARRSQPCPPPAQAPIHDCQSHPQRRRHPAIPRPRPPTAAAASGRVNQRHPLSQKSRNSTISDAPYEFESLTPNRTTDCFTDLRGLGPAPWDVRAAGSSGGGNTAPKSTPATDVVTPAHDAIGVATRGARRPGRSEAAWR